MQTQQEKWKKHRKPAKQSLSSENEHLLQDRPCGQDLAWDSVQVDGIEAIEV
jgi:hypothetical protein